MKLFIFDLETTGLNSQFCGIHQLSGVIAETNGKDIKFLDPFDIKMKPFKGKRIYQEALELGDITIDDIDKYQEPQEAYRQIIALIKKHVNKFNPNDKMFLVGYNSLHFDNDFLRQWFVDNGDNYFGSYFWSNGIDVMSEASRVLMNIRPYMPNFKLGTVAKTLGFEVKEDELHDGLVDVRLTARILIYCLRNPQVKTLDGYDIGKMVEECLNYKKEQKEKRKNGNREEKYFIFG